MKNHSFIIVGLGLFATASVCWAIDRPSIAPDGQQQVPGQVKAINAKDLPAANARGGDASSLIVPKQTNPLKGKLLLGIQPGTVSPALKAQLGLNGFPGIMVEDVVNGSPADKAGIRKFDIIVKVGEKPIAAPGSIREAIAEAEPGDTIPVEVIRSNKVEKLNLVLDQAMCLRDSLPGDSPAMPMTPDHIEKAIGAGKLAVPQNMCQDAELAAMLKMMSEVMDQNRAFNDPSTAIARIQRMRQLTDQLHRQIKPRQALFGSSGVLLSNDSYTANMVLRDAQGVIEVKTDSKNGTRLVVRDVKGQVIFDGPYSTDDDKSKIPDEIKQRMDGVCIHLQTR